MTKVCHERTSWVKPFRSWKHVHRQIASWWIHISKYGCYVQAKALLTHRMSNLLDKESWGVWILGIGSDQNRFWKLFTSDAKRGSFKQNLDLLINNFWLACIGACIVSSWFLGWAAPTASLSEPSWSLSVWALRFGRHILPYESACLSWCAPPDIYCIVRRVHILSTSSLSLTLGCRYV